VACINEAELRRSPSDRLHLLVPDPLGTHAQVRRQRRPADVVVVAPPGYPCRRPNSPGNPDPPVYRILDPAAIVIGDVPPRLIAYPRPAELSIRPSSYRVGTPAGSQTSRIWRPAHLVFRTPDPMTKAFQILCENLDFNVGECSRHRQQLSLRTDNRGLGNRRSATRKKDCTCTGHDGDRIDNSSS